MSTESQRQQKKTGEDKILKKQNVSNKNQSVGNIIFKDKTLYGSEIIFDYKCELIKDTTLSESDIDTKAVSILKDLGWKEHKEIRQQKTNISEIDDYIKSKTTKSKRKGHADVYLLINDKLRVVIDNKKPNESVDDGIEDASYYARCLLEMNYDIRIAMSYNGKECKLNVFDSDIHGWVPFLIDGKELSAFPSKELVEIIYRYKNINNIIITQDTESININDSIQGLKEIYRNVPFLQNDNQKTHPSGVTPESLRPMSKEF